MSRPSGGKERPLRATAFDFECFRQLPYMDISSSGESAHTCETSAMYCVSTRTERVLLFRARDANSRIVITRGPRIHDGARARQEQERKRKLCLHIAPLNGQAYSRRISKKPS